MINLFDLIDNANNPEIEQQIQADYTIGNRTIEVINNSEQLEEAMKSIQKKPFIGFDTEQKPTFKKGQASHGISLIQLATQDKCYLIQTKQINNLRPLLKILADSKTIKIGTGLKGDNDTLFNQFQLRPRATIDLENVFKKLSAKNQIGAKKAASIVLNQKLQKSKNMSRSNWENKELTEGQIKYATEDATVVFDVMKCLIKQYPFVMSIMPPYFQKQYINN